MSYDTVGAPGSDSEYFVEDRDSVYCQHGRFVGYPGGADFICGYCEDGANTLEYRMYARLEYTVEDDWFDGGHVLATVYTPEGIHKWDEFIYMWKATGGGALGMDLYWEFGVEAYWVRSE